MSASLPRPRSAMERWHVAGAVAVRAGGRLVYVDEPGQHCAACDHELHDEAIDMPIGAVHVECAHGMVEALRRLR